MTRDHPRCDDGAGCGDPASHPTVRRLVRHSGEGPGHGELTTVAVHLAEPSGVIGRTTQASLQSGMVYGFAGAIEKPIDSPDAIPMCRGR